MREYFNLTSAPQCLGRLPALSPGSTRFLQTQRARRNHSGSAWEIALSKDPQQKYIYLTDGENEKVYIMDRM